ncbi:MAG TPA: carboxypeptidase-like regulatory domain-containing protein [Chryseosolibacter sp.]
MRIYLSFVLLLLAGFCNGQKAVTGIVVDSATFAPLPYVNIQVKSSTKGTSTDSNGNFSILASDRDTLVFSLLGYHRLELPLYDYEASVIRLSERVTQLKPITIIDTKFKNPYEGLFDEQNAALVRRKLPFYFSKAKKEKIRFDYLKNENLRVKTYVDLVINNPSTKSGLMKKYSLTEDEYYKTLTKFNERYYNVMYHLTSAELESFLNKFFESEHF